MEKHTHNIPPVFDKNSKILILGSFPSVKSRETEFFYGNKQNRFWKVIAKILNIDVPETTEEKKKILLNYGIALWDVIESCDIEGSSDSSIKNVTPNNLSIILECADIKQIFTNGKAAEKYYNRYLKNKFKHNSICLSSTSPANATKNFDKLTAEWKVILKYL